MNWILLATLSAFIALAAGAPSMSEVKRPETCKEGDTWKEDCNNCWCDNGHPACTLMACIARPSRSADHLEPCTPLSAWKEGSKYCTCSERGVKSCVQEITRSKREAVEDVIAHQEELHKECHDGTVWKTNCVDCKCIDKRPQCSKVLDCVPGPIYYPKSTCDGDETWHDECKNLCKCLDGKPVCTKASCEAIPHRPRPALLNKIKEKQQKMTNRGTSYTNGRFKRDISVDDVITHEVEMKKNCTVNTVWKSNCVKCKCTDSGPQCSAVEGCTPGLITTPKTTCEGEEKWMDDCNHCWCNKGTPACTRKLCESHAHYEISLPMPTEGEEQKSPVTKREVTEEKHCKPGTAWIKMTDNDEGCAKFKCHADGTVTSKPHFTREMCPSEPEFVQDDDDDQQQHVLKREAGCKPGDKWMEDCNECTCNEEGKGSCSRMLCEKDADEIPWLSEQEEQQEQQQQHTKRETSCKPGTVWIKMTDNDEGCAKFRCHADGTVTSKPHFTRELCPSEPEFVQDDDDEQQQKQQQHVSKREAGCKPGTVWIKMTDNDEGCAKFRCHADGSVTSKPHFTRELCPSEPEFVQDDDDEQQQHVSKREAGCKPGDKWMEDCNECTCNKEGKGSCSRMLCEKDADEISWLSEQEEQQQQQHTKRETSCKPGTVWIKMTDNDEGCAKFRCHADGTVTSKPHFTRELCPSEPEFVQDDDDEQQQQQQHHASKREAGCKPGTVWIKMTDNDEGCAKYRCHADGTVTSKPHFTRELCPSEPEYVEDDDDEQQQQQHVSKREAGCKPGTVWIKMTDNDEGCAKFRCHADGTVTSKPHFTREMCPSEPEFVQDDDDDDEQQQQHQQHVSKRESGCKPGDKWMEDCNECTCNEEGKGSCSRMLCEKDADEIPWLSEPDEQQQQQQQQHTKREAGCKPGTVWIKMTDNDEGCAKFRCHANGTVTSKPHFTRELCPSEPEFVQDDDDEQQQQQQHVSKREAGCKPGDKWMEDCNECTCNDEGKGSCTRMLCEKDADEISWLSEQEEQQQHQHQHTKRETRMIRIRRSQAPPIGCKAGDTYFDGCNQCVCVESGPPSCTYKICPPDTQVHTVSFGQLSEQSQQNVQQAYI